MSEDITNSVVEEPETPKKEPISKPRRTASSVIGSIFTDSIVGISDKVIAKFEEAGVTTLTSLQSIDDEEANKIILSAFSEEAERLYGQVAKRKKLQPQMAQALQETASCVNIDYRSLFRKDSLGELSKALWEISGNCDIVKIRENL